MILVRNNRIQAQKRKGASLKNMAEKNIKNFQKKAKDFFKPSDIKRARQKIKDYLGKMRQVDCTTTMPNFPK